MGPRPDRSRWQPTAGPAATAVGIVLLAGDDHGLEAGDVGQVVGDRALAFLVDEDDLGTRVGQSVGELLARPPGVEGDGDGADGDGGPERHDPLGQVAHGDGHPVAGPHPEPVDQLAAELGDDAVCSAKVTRSSS